MPPEEYLLGCNDCGETFTGWPGTECPACGSYDTDSVEEDYGAPEPIDEMEEYGED